MTAYQPHVPSTLFHQASFIFSFLISFSKCSDTQQNLDRQALRLGGCLILMKAADNIPLQQPTSCLFGSLLFFNN